MTPWVATHLAEFVLVLVALAGLLLLCGALRRETPYLALMAGGAIIATGATWAVLQAVDGVTLKQAGRRVAASGPKRHPLCRCGNRSLDRVGPPELLPGPARRGLPALGAAAVVSRLVELARCAPGSRRPALPRRGVSVGYEGLESGFQDPVGIAFQIVVLRLIAGLLVVSRRVREPGTRALAP